MGGARFAQESLDLVRFALAFCVVTTPEMFLGQPRTLMPGTRMPAGRQNKAKAEDIADYLLSPGSGC